MRKYKEIEVSEYERLINDLGESDEIDLANFDLIIYGSCGQDRRFYKDISNNQKYELLWTGWSGPSWTKFLSFIPGQAGLIKVLDRTEFKDIFYDLSSLSVSDAIYVPKHLTCKITDDAKSNSWSSKFESYVLQANGAFMITAETDETIERKGKEYYFYDYYFGENISESLRAIIENTKN